MSISAAAQHSTCQLPIHPQPTYHLFSLSARKKQTKITNSIVPIDTLGYVYCILSEDRQRQETNRRKTRQNFLYQSKDKAKLDVICCLINRENVSLWPLVDSFRSVPDSILAHRIFHISHSVRKSPSVVSDCVCVCARECVDCKPQHQVIR